MRRIALVAACLLTLSGSAYAIAPPAGPPGNANKPCDKGRPFPSVQPSKEVTDPAIEGPVEGGIRTGEPFGTTMVPLDKGWIEQEFFFEGTAKTVDEKSRTTPYKSRILVRRPTDPRAFNGTVIVDWNNVTLAFDKDVSWAPMHRTIMNAGSSTCRSPRSVLSIEVSPIALKQYDPVRYGSLSHPGDDYSFDIFSQAAQAAVTRKCSGRCVRGWPAGSRWVRPSRPAG